MSIQDTIINIQNLSTYFGKVCVHNNVNLSVFKGEIVALVGNSGSGKTTLLRNILMLQQPTSGIIDVFGHDVTQQDAKTISATRRKIGVMFQRGALFTSLTVEENIAFPLTLYTHLKKQIIKDIARLKLSLVGLPLDAARKYPSELSGGMIKRAAVARAIALDPELLILDEPTAGLDPNGADALDNLILDLKSSLDLTIVMVTHDLDTLWHITDRVAFLGEGRVLKASSMHQLMKSEHPLIQQFFMGTRGRKAMQNNTEEKGH